MFLTAVELLAEGIRQLKAAGIDDAEVSARLLLQHTLNKTPSELQMTGAETISNSKIIIFKKLIEKRCTHFPLQYLVGEVEFFNVKLKVNRNVLIPRPETEILVENIIAILVTKKSPKLLEIGVGSGNIAIAIAANIDDIRITAVDISEDALCIARENAGLNCVADKIDFICGDCLQDELWKTVGKYDAIVSNPPYVADNEWESLQPEVKMFEPKVALLSGDDPLKYFKTITRHSKSKLNHDGIICFEVGAGKAPDVATVLKANHNNIEITIIKDLAGLERVVIGKLY